MQTMARINIGVSGHRLLPHAKTEACVRVELLRIREAYPDARFRIVASLAAGADRLVVTSAMELLDATLVAVLPMPAKEFKKDFADAQSVRDLKGLLKSAERVIEAPILTSGTAWRRYTDERNHQYAWATAYVAHNADILIALWDGRPARGTGGTAYAVEWFRWGRTPREYAMSRSRLKRGLDKRQLIHINTATLAVRRSKCSA